MGEWTKSDDGGGGGSVPAGFIGMWSGDHTDVPDGWTLCDGSHPDGDDSDVPDLRQRFIVGAGSGNSSIDSDGDVTDYDVGETGGKEEHQLKQEELARHNHSGIVERGDRRGRGRSSRGHATGYDSTNSTGQDEPHENRPPYYALAFIMKL